MYSWPSKILVKVILKKEISIHKKCIKRDKQLHHLRYIKKHKKKLRHVRNRVAPCVQYSTSVSMRSRKIGQSSIILKDETNVDGKGEQFSL